jgi:hypothetical protein
MLYEQSRGCSIKGKREKAVRRYNNKEDDGTKDHMFKNTLRSLFSGSIDHVPEQLHLFLDGCGGIGSQKIRWVPFHLEYVLEHVTLGDESTLSKLSLEMAKLCKGLKEADKASGKGWEALFVIFLVARCINGCHDGYFLREDWFRNRSFKFEFNPNSSPKTPFSSCQTWDQLKEGITASETPTVSIFYPSHASFNVYDVIAEFSERNSFVHHYGYQLKEGKSNSKQPPHPDFYRSFVVKGSPPGASNGVFHAATSSTPFMANFLLATRFETQTHSTFTYSYWNTTYYTSDLIFNQELQLVYTFQYCKAALASQRIHYY